MQTNPENTRRAGELIKSLAALNRGFGVPPDAARALILALLELPTLDDAARCVKRLLNESDRLPTPAEIHAWRRANTEPGPPCKICDGTGNVAAGTVETRLGPQLVYARCACTRSSGAHPQEAA